MLNGVIMIKNVSKVIIHYNAFFIRDRVRFIEWNK